MISYEVLKVSVKRIKTVIHAGQSTTISCKCQAEVVEKRTSLLFTADSLHIPEGLSIAETVVVAKKSSKQLLSDTTHYYLKYQYNHKGK